MLLAAFWHAVQHCTLPVIFDVRFVLWRLTMFLPFALLIAVVVRRWPRLLPYMMIGHVLMDMQLGAMVLSASL